MQSRILYWLFHLLLVLGVVLLAVGAWGWWTEGPPVTALAFPNPVQLGTIAVDEDRAIEIMVTNTSKAKVRLVGLKDESC